MGHWDDKFARAERKWASWKMQEYGQADRILPNIIQDKARINPNREVFRFREHGVTLEELNHRTNQVACGFVELGVRHGDKVALMLPNCAEFLYAWFGLNRIGAVSVPINVAQRGDVLAYQINHAECVAIIAHDEYLPHLDNISTRITRIKHLVMLGSGTDIRLQRWPGVTGLHFSELCGISGRTPKVALDFRNLSTISYTSGTTGLSKGVMISHHYWYEIWASAVQYARYTEDDVLYTGLPFFHTSAHGTTGPAILADAKAILADRFSASRMMDDCRRWNCTSAKYIGSIIPILMKQEPSEKDLDNPLRLMVGSATPSHLWHAFEQRYNTRLLELYGMTECNSCLVNPFENRRPGSCGKAINGYDVMVVDELDNELADGQVGEIVVRPRKMHLGTEGYYRNPEATVELFRNLWIHTGDLARRDDDGYFYFVDRKKQALRRRGENISSFEVEAVIDAHPAVLESCVVGVASELGEEDVKAVIVLKEGCELSEDELIRWCEPRLAYFAIPRYVAYRKHLPKTSSERVEKYILKQEGVTFDCWDRERNRDSLAMK